MPERALDRHAELCNHLQNHRMLAYARLFLVIRSTGDGREGGHEVARQVVASQSYHCSRSVREVVLLSDHDPSAQVKMG